MSIIINLKTVRLKQGLSQKDIANAVDSCPRTISNIERGKYFPSLETALRIAKYLDVSVEKLFSIDDE